MMKRTIAQTVPKMKDRKYDEDGKLIVKQKHVPLSDKEVRAREREEQELSAEKVLQDKALYLGETDGKMARAVEEIFDAIGDDGRIDKTKISDEVKALITSRKEKRQRRGV